MQIEVEKQLWSVHNKSKQLLSLCQLDSRVTREAARGTDNV